jgi:hypothetical protein
VSHAERYVPKDAIRDAVRGRELAVVRALGIDWSSGRGHIRCPYPDHGGEADWRWDDKQAKAICSCATWHSIFDVVMKLEGLDFERAKIRVAEILDRSDLIRDGTMKRYQATDAESLLSPDPENRDDSLVWSYLAYRLGIESADVPRPCTLSVGIKALGYYDPPPRGTRNRVLVATVPCIVFETISTNGKRHAHRIYVAPGGMGKADLGTGPDGGSRDPKKSARVIGRGTTAGYAVVWGSPSTAETAIVAEGIETAAAIALAMRPKMDAGQIMVVSCISAVGVEAFVPWPATRRIIIAADRDEASKPDGRPGSRRGEKAAHVFANRHAHALPISIALPGEPGQSIDWLDILRRDGVQAVRTRLEAAVPFTPTSDCDRRENKPEKIERENEKQSDVIVRVALANAELFHTAQGEAFADIRVDGHRATWAVRDRNFKLWLLREYYLDTSSAPNSDAMRTALDLLEAKARFEGDERTVAVRIAGICDKIYVDLGTRDWSVVEITADSWRIVADPPVRFRRSRGMRPLPIPEHGGDVRSLKSFLNVRTDSDFMLIVGWLVAALRNRGPYPVLVLTGEQGTAKSTLARVLKALIDPNIAPLRSLPREDRDLFISAHNGHVLAFDNVSHLPPWLSDSLARLATGGGFGTRALFTDDEETLFNGTRPIILNGIENFVTRGDLGDRAIVLALAVIPDALRRDEETFWADFDHAAPLIFGALLDAVAHGLKSLSSVTLDRKPRMADFARWVVACEGALPWPGGAFMRAYDENRTEAVAAILESDSVAMAVRLLLAKVGCWKGTSGDLLKALNGEATDEARQAKDWPKTPRGMSGALTRAAPGLRKLGYSVELGQRSTDRRRTRTNYLACPIEQGEPSSEPSEPSENRVDNHCGADGRADGPGFTSERPSNPNLFSRELSDDSDGTDDRVHADEEQEWTE